MRGEGTLISLVDSGFKIGDSKFLILIIFLFDFFFLGGGGGGVGGGVSEKINYIFWYKDFCGYFFGVTTKMDYFGGSFLCFYGLFYLFKIQDTEWKHFWGVC